MNTKRQVEKVLIASEKTFSNILASDLLNLDFKQVEITANSIISLPQIAGIEIKADNNEQVVQAGTVLDKNRKSLTFHSFALYNGYNTTSHIGDVKLFANEEFIINNIKSSAYLLIFNATIKTAAIFLLIFLIFRKLLTKPLSQLASSASQINPNELEKSLIAVANNPNDELGVLQSALNAMINKTAEAFDKLDKINKNLESIVNERTEELQQTISQLNKQQDRLLCEIETRQKSEQALTHSLHELKNAQTQLIEAEKMASLGSLVAGVAHEINTPVGLSLTGISHFQATVDEISKLFEAGELEEDHFLRFIQESKELSCTIQNSLQRAANLVKSFKLVAVDQSAEEVRQFDIIQYLKDTMTSLNNKLKQSKVNFEINCDSEVLIINNYPGSWAQVFTNLIQNTLIHAYEPNSTGQIVLTFYTEGEELIFKFIDDGKGMTEESQKKIFDPFYTTNRTNGGSGLGMNIIFNIITQKMSGKITVDSELGKGTQFTIKVPIDIQSFK
ncbi:sensor histidine kinase [Pseudoalteromonas aurantia]|uniref:sensor histidine kinase n=1 Tax=Pseudoalteromonas aurantia TaxID=43654 RepID=UPI001485CC11|nr:HAMP domain-containing sensor histidine kinase [Pseudoalteromonas aurantia]